MPVTHPKPVQSPLSALNADKPQTPPSKKKQGQASESTTPLVLEQRAQPRTTAEELEAELLTDAILEDRSDMQNYAVFCRDAEVDATYASASEPNMHHSAQHDDKETLLPDTGAVGNLVGMNTAKRICASARRLGNKVTWSRLKVPKIVSGVGSGAAVAEFQVLRRVGVAR
eukprot:3678261-Amphidinium_carterae.1